MNTDQPPPRDEALVSLLWERDGLASEVVLDDGQKLTVWNIAWGYDFGDEYAHVTTNASPGIEGAPIGFFSTSSVVAVIDPVDGAVLLESPR